MRGLIAAVALGAGLVVIPASAVSETAPGSAARAAAKSFETKVKLKEVIPSRRRPVTPMRRGTSYFNGVVKSQKNACRKLRPLVLLRDGAFHANGMSDEDGKFEIENGTFPPGTYRVQAPLKETENYTCKADKSGKYVRES